jgi:Flp pilus assembly protein TadD
MGRLLLDLGETRLAICHLEKAGELDGRMAGAFYALWQARMRMGETNGATEALETFRKLQRAEQAELDARNAGYDDGKFMRALSAGFHTELAEYLLRKGRGPAAEAHLREAMRVGPEEVRAYEVLAAVLLRSERPEEARRIYETLVRINPARSEYRVNLGTLLLQLRDPAAAVEQLERALELEPEQPEALGNLARYYLTARTNLLEAMALSHRLVQSQPTAAGYDLLGWACFANGRVEEARSAAAQATKLAPTNAVYRERLRRLESLQ